MKLNVTRAYNIYQGVSRIQSCLDRFSEKRIWSINYYSEISVSGQQITPVLMTFGYQDWMFISKSFSLILVSMVPIKEYKT